MANALVRHDAMTDEQVGLIKRMIAKDATNDELQLFLHQCQRTGLDPFSKQIYAISRWSKDAGRKVMAIQISIDGARLTAERTSKYDNQEGPYWCGEDGEWKDVWLAKVPPRAAKVLVYKVGSSRATTGIAHWDEYHDSKSSFWTTKPALMLAKCAEMLALRKAFPQELSGLYAQEEMGQADVVDVTPTIVESPQNAQTPHSARNGSATVQSGTQAAKTSQQAATQATGDDNPFDEVTPIYVRDWRHMTGKPYDLVQWLSTLHRNSKGACTEKQYGFLVSLVDALSDGGHRYVLSVLCQSEISSKNMPGKDAASALLKILPETVKGENGESVPNQGYRADVAEMITGMAQGQQVAA